MATAAPHQMKWLRHRAFAATIDAAYPDWMVVAVFHAALHAVETLLRHDEVRVHGGHTARNQTPKGYNRHRQIRRHDHPLYDATRTARYEVASDRWVSAEDVKGRLAKRLYRLEQSVLKLTRQDRSLPPVCSQAG